MRFYTYHRDNHFKKQLIHDLITQLFETEMPVPLSMQESCSQRIFSSTEQAEYGETGRSWRAHSHVEDAGVREAFTLLLAVRKQDSNSPKQIHDMSNMLHHNIKECTSITWSALAYSMTYLNKIR